MIGNNVYIDTKKRKKKKNKVKNDSEKSENVYDLHLSNLKSDGNYDEIDKYWLVREISKLVIVLVMLLR